MSGLSFRQAIWLMFIWQLARELISVRFRDNTLKTPEPTVPIPQIPTLTILTKNTFPT